jgi:uncharacterized protein
MPTRDVVETTRSFLAALAQADYAAWDSLVAQDVVMRFPFAPRGLPRTCTGREACRKLVQGLFSVISRFRWLDLDLHATDDAELVCGTGRSEAMTTMDRAYANRYCFVVRVRDERIIEYCEYFDPLPAMDVFREWLDGASAEVPPSRPSRC